MGQLSPSCEKTQAHMHCCMTSIESSDSQDVLLRSACMSVVCITCLYSYMRHSCLCTCEGVEKAEVIASLPSGTPPAPTTTEGITSKLEWMCTCGSLLSHVCTYVHHPLHLPNTTFMQECYSGSHNQQLHSRSQQVVSLFQGMRSTQQQSLCQTRQ